MKQSPRQKLIESSKKFSVEKKVFYFVIYLVLLSVRRDFILKSDIDFAVYLDKKKCSDFFEKRLEIISKISQVLKKEVDVVILNTAPPFLRYVVLFPQSKGWGLRQRFVNSGCIKNRGVRFFVSKLTLVLERI